MDRESHSFVKAIRPIPPKFVCFPFFGVPPFLFSTSFRAPQTSQIWNLRARLTNYSLADSDARKRAPVSTRNSDCCKRRAASSNEQPFLVTAREKRPFETVLKTTGNSEKMEGTGLETVSFRPCAANARAPSWNCSHPVYVYEYMCMYIYIYIFEWTFERGISWRSYNMDRNAD